MKEQILNYLIEKELEARKEFNLPFNNDEKDTQYLIGYLDAVAEIRQYISKILLENE